MAVVERGEAHARELGGRLAEVEAMGYSRERAEGYIELLRERAGDKLYRRLGWMTRAHPFVLDGRRLIVPLYSDGFDCSLMAITDDWGATWRTSNALCGLGNVQPSIVRRRDGSLSRQNKVVAPDASTRYKLPSCVEPAIQPPAKTSMPSALRSESARISRAICPEGWPLRLVRARSDSTSRSPVSDANAPRSQKS